MTEAARPRSEMAKLKLVDSSAGGPPRPLSKGGMAMWDRYMRGYDISDEAGREYLAMLCEATERGQQFTALIDEHGVAQINEKTGRITANPLCKLELECRAQAAKLLERLGINELPAQANGRPTGSFSYEKENISYLPRIRGAILADSRNPRPRGEISPCPSRAAVPAARTLLVASRPGTLLFPIRSSQASPVAVQQEDRPMARASRH